MWGTGKSASADGTKWDLYEQNLLSEYQIRYGGYGGIGYYHVSDTYIALFSHFIPCGVWEAIYILEGLLKNKSDIQPDTVHADTQGQTTPVFALSLPARYQADAAYPQLERSDVLPPEQRRAVRAYRYRYSPTPSIGI